MSLDSNVARVRLNFAPSRNPFVGDRVPALLSASFQGLEGDSPAFHSFCGMFWDVWYLWSLSVPHGDGQ